MITKTRCLRRPRLWGLISGLALLAAPLFTLMTFATAQAAPVCTTNSNQVTCIFNYTGAAETWTVPADVTQATFDLYGAQGGGRLLTNGNQGGQVTAQLAVTPGAVYQINVGGTTTNSTGGFNGGGNGYQGGGGASDVRTGSFALNERILVAGGGGGIGGGDIQGGDGGAGGYPKGGDGKRYKSTGIGGIGGGADSGLPAGGAPGSSHSGYASHVATGGGIAKGGDGGMASALNHVINAGHGGGGGGGYGGGGGGGINDRGIGDAGGGGGSYGPANATYHNGVRMGNGLVIITYTDLIAPVAKLSQAPAANTNGWNNTDVTVNWNWSDAVSGVDPAHCTTSSTSSGEGPFTLTATCQDLAGNTGNASVTGKVDKSAPTISLSATTADGAPYTADTLTTQAVTVNFTCNDNLAGVVSCPPAQTVNTEGRTTVGGTVTDMAGNSTSVIFPIRINRTPGSVVGWGNNTFGEINIPAGLSNVTALAASGNVNLALKSDGTLSTWGDNSLGQLALPAGLSGVTAMAASGHSLALKSDGTVIAWGFNNYGQATVPAGLSGVVAVAAVGLHSLALKSDGTVVAWGDNRYGQSTTPAGLSGVTAIAAGFYHSLALKSDGTVVAWGQNTAGQSVVPAGLSGVAAIAAGFYHNLALKSDGTVVAWGQNNYGQSVVPAGLSGVTAIAAGGAHNLALKSDGTVVAWGLNNMGQLNLPAGLSGVLAIAGGGYHSLALVSSAVASAASVNAASAVTQSVPVTAPAAVANPAAVTTTQQTTNSAQGAGAAPATPDATGQNQKLFLPVVKNLSGASLSSASWLSVLGLLVLVIGGGFWFQRSRKSRS